VPANHTPELEATARTLGLTLDVVEVERPDDIGPAINLAKSRGAEALNVLASPMLNGSASNVAASAREAGLPACVSGVKWQRRVVLSAMGLPSWKGIACTGECDPGEVSGEGGQAARLVLNAGRTKPVGVQALNGEGSRPIQRRAEPDDLSRGRN